MSRTGSPVEEAHTTESVADGTTPIEAIAPARTVDADAATRVTVIRPARRIPYLDMGELWHYRELLWTLVWRDVAVRYKQTFLGVAWAILVPAFTALIYVIIFGKFANFPAGDDALPQPRRRRRAADAVLRVGAHPLEPEPAREPAARHEGVLPADAAAALGRRVPLVDFVIGLPILLVLMARYDTWPGRLAGPDGAAVHPARGRDRARHRRCCSPRSTSATATCAT